MFGTIILFTISALCFLLVAFLQAGEVYEARTAAADAAECLADDLYCAAFLENWSNKSFDAEAAAALNERRTLLGRLPDPTVQSGSTSNLGIGVGGAV